MKLILEEQRRKLLANHEATKDGESALPLEPVVRLFDPYGSATWLLVSMNDDEYAFGLCDLGIGFPEMGDVYLPEVRSVLVMGHPRIERDMHWTARGTFGEYVEAANSAQTIVELPA